jgi:hypothetical protein
MMESHKQKSHHKHVRRQYSLLFSYITGFGFHLSTSDDIDVNKYLT